MLVSTSLKLSRRRSAAWRKISRNSGGNSLKSEIPQIVEIAMMMSFLLGLCIVKCSKIVSQDLAILSSLRKAHAYKAFFKGREVLYLSVVISKSYVYFLDGMEIRTVNPMAPIMQDIAKIIRAGGTECPQRHLTQIEHLQCDLS